jgi:hypothetical protein
VKIFPTNRPVLAVVANWLALKAFRHGGKRVALSKVRSRFKKRASEIKGRQRKND